MDFRFLKKPLRCHPILPMHMDARDGQAPFLESCQSWFIITIWQDLRAEVLQSRPALSASEESEAAEEVDMAWKALDEPNSH